jgi:hypothetical protein
MNKTGFYLNARRVSIYIYKDELYGTPFYRTTCDRVSLLLAIRICKMYGVNLQRLAKKYYKRENKRQGWLDVKQRLKLADKIHILDTETGEILLNITQKSSNID